MPAADASSAEQLFSGVTSKSWTHTPAGSLNAVYVFVACLGYPSDSGTVSGVTYGGNAMSLKDSYDVVVGGTGTLRLLAYKLMNPPTGAQTVAVSFTSACYGVAGSISLTGVDTASPDGTVYKATGNSSSPAVSVTSTTVGRLILCGAMFRYGGQTITEGKTLAWKGRERPPSSGYAGGCEYTDATGSAVSMDWTLSSNNNWTCMAFEVYGTTYKSHWRGRSSMLGGGLR